VDNNYHSTQTAAQFIYFSVYLKTLNQLHNNDYECVTLGFRVSHIKSRELSNISANIAVAIFRENV
jgi:hypothetical protein